MVRSFLILLAVALAGTAGFYGTGSLLDAAVPGAQEEAGVPEPRETRVTLTQAEPLQVVDDVEAIGTTRARRSVTLRPAAEGRIVALGFRTGDRVEEGDVLVQFDDRAERAALKQAQAQYDRARNDLARARSLSERNVTSEANLEQVRAELLAAEGLVEAARTAVDDRRIVAPFSGTAGITDYDVGQRIDAATTITTLDDLEAVDIAFFVPEPYYGRVEDGLAVEATTSAYPDRTFTGTVNEIGTRIDPTTRAFPVRARIDNADRALSAGMFMNATLKLGERGSLSVPEQSVVARGDANFVFVAADGKVSRREVTLGRRLGENVEIVGGLDDGATVVVGGVQTLEDGDPITAVEPARGAEDEAVG